MSHTDIFSLLCLGTTGVAALWLRWSLRTERHATERLCERRDAERKRFLAEMDARRSELQGDIEGVLVALLRSLPRDAAESVMRQMSAIAARPDTPPRIRDPHLASIAKARDTSTGMVS